VILKSCYSDIPETIRELCNDSDVIDCNRCSGDNCNDDTVRRGTKCYTCSGLNCLIIDSPTNIVDCQSSCYIGINENGETTRGCASDFNNPDQCSFDKNSPNECFVCAEDKCNAIIYPLAGRLVCYNCREGNCGLSDDKLQYCPIYNQDERCVTVFDDGADEVIARSCLSVLDNQFREACYTKPSNCFKCDSPKCNIDESKSKTEYCIGCDSEDDPKCLEDDVTQEKRCSTNKCFTRLKDKSEDYFGRHIERGCLDDLEQTRECLEPDCISCTGRNCNNKIFPEDRISCKYCELSQCENEMTDKICNQYVDNEACFTFFGEEGEVIYKDCFSDAPFETRKVCDNSTDLGCTKCEGNLCNIDTVRRGSKCYKCSGIDCFIPLITNVIECLSGCYVGVNEDGFPLRDCADAIPDSLSCGTKNFFCMICFGDFCNSNVFPIQNRRTCLKCKNEECETLQTISQYCEKFNPDEKCVTIFDEYESVIERGCSSTLANLNMCSYDNPNCLHCGFDECNVETSPTEKYHCVSCSSSGNAKCVTNPMETSIQSCPVEQCYSKLLPADGNGQHIERGCASQISSCSRDSCEICNGEMCNVNIFPSDRHSCFFCSGDHCAFGHSTQQQCVLYNQSDNKCVTIFGDKSEVIYRDCYVDAAQGTKNICDNLNDLTCTQCSGINCNNDLERRGTKCLKCEGLECFNVIDTSNSIDCSGNGCYVGLNEKGETKRDCADEVFNENCVTNDDEDGVCLICKDDYCNAIAFPMTNRLMCKTCVSDSCEYNQLDNKYCETISSVERCVTVFDNNEKVIERGCLSTIQNIALCSENSPNCIKCNFSECNIQESKEQMFYCVSCNSQDDPACVLSSETPTITSCKTNQCYSKLISIYAESPWQYVEKGCVSDLQSTTTCSDETCTICDGDRCNNILYPSDRFSCFSCHSSSCEMPSITSSICKLYNREQQGCITLFGMEDEVFYRGCYSDAADGTRKVCDDESQLLCSFCNTDNCNSDTKRRGRKCFQCEGLSCFQPVYPSDAIDCLSNCYIGINQNGENVRGCESSFINTTSCGNRDADDDQCYVCDDDFCNGIQFPLRNRLQCHTCSEEDNCTDDDENLEYCQRYSEHERCVTVFSEDDKVIERGCLSSIQNQQYCDQNYDNCLQCSSTACNKINSKISRTCVTCDSKQNVECIVEPSSMPTKNCRKGCYTMIINGNLIRGCLDDVDDDFKCSIDNNCNYCNDIEKCNSENYPKDRKRCLTCNGTNSCNNPTSQLCTRYEINDSCVTIFNRYQVEKKGCLADQSLEDQVVCSDSTNGLCASCSHKDNCNIATVRSDENCIICNSALDSKCAQTPNELNVEHCSSESNGECFARIEGSLTIRGCKGDLSLPDFIECNDNKNSSQCLIAFGQGSNDGMVPRNRLTCYHCDSKIDPGCVEDQVEQTNNKPLPCKNYLSPEKCFILKYHDGNIVRGCVADFSADICQQGTCTKTCEEPDCNFNHSIINKVDVICLSLSIIFYLIMK
ncbi:CLUMA_CG014195, isoform A, partial [Clunio marinus]